MRRVATNCDETSKRHPCVTVAVIPTIKYLCKQRKTEQQTKNIDCKTAVGVFLTRDNGAIRNSCVGINLEYIYNPLRDNGAVRNSCVGNIIKA